MIVENESCQHRLNSVRETVAILGAGFDLNWTTADWLGRKHIAYSGDIDAWGLQVLANARAAIGKLDALMMTPEIFEQFADSAVPEPIAAAIQVPAGLHSQSELPTEGFSTSNAGDWSKSFFPRRWSTNPS